MESESFRNRRRNYFINKRFQSSFIIKFCALVIIGSLISAALIYAMSRATVTTTFENSRLAIKSTADYILPAVLLASAIVIVVIGVATIIVTLFTSHKIAGPLYRIEKDTEQAASGDLTMKFAIREGDQMRPLAAQFRTMVAAMRERIEAIKRITAALDAAAGRDGASKEITDNIRDLKAAVDRFKT